jgi:hypothetical protein
MKASEFRESQIPESSVNKCDDYYPLLMESPALLDIAMSVVDYVGDRDNLYDIEAIADRAREIIARIDEEVR